MTLLRASLPPLDGHVPFSRDLPPPVTIARDAAGVPTLSGAAGRIWRVPSAIFTGRTASFEMDLMRRAAAGELSALLGSALLPEDRRLRVHRFRDVAERVVARLDAPGREMLAAYTAGRQRRAQLAAQPPLRVLAARAAGPSRGARRTPSFACTPCSCSCRISSGHGQLQHGLLRAALPEPLWRFLESDAADLDASIEGSRAAEPPIPTAAQVDLRKLRGMPVLPPDESLRQLALGSNNWAVAGIEDRQWRRHRRQRHASGLSGADHLVSRQACSSRATSGFDAIGVTLPGAPTLVAGSNGHIAWGFTNSYGRFSQVIRLVPVADDPDGYAPRTAAMSCATWMSRSWSRAGPPSISGGAERMGTGDRQGLAGPALRVRVDRPGPGRDQSRSDVAGTHRHRGRGRCGAAPRFGMPGQNLMVADRDGHIGWTLAGRLPRRADARCRRARARPPIRGIGFSGWVDAASQPRMLDPPEGIALVRQRARRRRQRCPADRR